MYSVVVGGKAGTADDFSDENWSSSSARHYNDNGEPMSIQQMIDSGVPIISSGNSAVGNFNGAMQTFGTSWDEYKQFIMENTDKNNAWSAKQAQDQMAFQERMNQIAMEFNASEAQKNRDWQEYMSSTAHVREMNDLKAAGLNPILTATGGSGAAVGSGASAQGVTSAGAKGDTDESANAAMAQFYSSMIAAQSQMYNADLSAQTNLAIADKQAAATMYAAQMAADTARSNNPYQIFTTLIDQLFADNQGNRGSGYGNVVAVPKKVVKDLGDALDNLYARDPVSTGAPAIDLYRAFKRNSNK